MITTELGFSIGPGKRGFSPRPIPAGHRRVMFRCQAKGCKFTKAADIPVIQKAYVRRFEGMPPTYETLDTDACRRAQSSFRCDKHPTAAIGFDEVKGSFSESRKCDPRCTGAIGPNCECQCGGANHGCDHL